MGNCLRAYCGCKKTAVVGEEEPSSGVDKNFEGEEIDVHLKKNDVGIGIRLQLECLHHKSYITVMAFKSKGGNKGPAERSDKIKPGDCIIKLDGVPVPMMENPDMDPDDYNTEDEIPDFHKFGQMLRDAPGLLKLTIRKRLVAEEGDKGPRNSIVVAVRQAVLAGPDAKLPPKGNSKFHHEGNDKYERAQTDILNGSYQGLMDECIYHYSRCSRKNPLGETVLHVLCREGYEEGVRFLIDPANHSVLEKCKLNINELNKQKRNGLMLVFTPKHVTGCGKGQRKLEDPKPGQVIMKMGERKQRCQIIELLIKYGIDVQLLDKEGWSAVHFAAMWGWEEALKALLAAGCRPETKNLTGSNALHIACQYGHDACALIMLEVLLPSKQYIKLEDNDGNMPLHLAAMSGATEAVEALVKLGADANLPNLKDETPLKLAIKKSRPRTASFLLKIPGLSRKKSALNAATGETKEYLDLRKEEGAFKVRKDQKWSADDRKLALAKGAQVQIANLGTWEKFKDPYQNGKAYYVNSETKASTWDKPDAYVEDPHTAMKKPKKMQNNKGWVQHVEPE